MCSIVCSSLRSTCLAGYLLLLVGSHCLHRKAVTGHWLARRTRNLGHAIHSHGTPLLFLPVLPVHPLWHMYHLSVFSLVAFSFLCDDRHSPPSSFRCPWPYSQLPWRPKASAKTTVSVLQLCCRIGNTWHCFLLLAMSSFPIRLSKRGLLVQSEELLGGWNRNGCRKCCCCCCSTGLHLI
jgi:hypothetical protein